MMGENELKLLIAVANDYIATLSPSASFCVGEQVKQAVGNLEAYLKAFSEQNAPKEVEE